MSSWWSRFQSRWLGGPSRDSTGGGAALEGELAALDREAEHALPGSSGQYLNRAGDLCHTAGDLARALGFYGRAIDAYLETGRYDAAAAVCRKLLRIAPSVVRARCTLAWLSIGKGLLRDARRDVLEYVSAARSAGQDDVAREQLHMMAEATTHAELRELIAELLRDLGDAEGAERVSSGAAGRVEGEFGGDAVVDVEELWARVLRAALMPPDEVLERRGRSLTDRS